MCPSKLPTEGRFLSGPRPCRSEARPPQGRPAGSCLRPSREGLTRPTRSAGGPLPLSAPRPRLNGPTSLLNGRGDNSGGEQRRPPDGSVSVSVPSPPLGGSRRVPGGPSPASPLRRRSPPSAGRRVFAPKIARGAECGGVAARPGTGRAALLLWRPPEGEGPRAAFPHAVSGRRGRGGGKMSAHTHTHTQRRLCAAPGRCVGASCC